MNAPQTPNLEALETAITGNDGATGRTAAVHDLANRSIVQRERGPRPPAVVRAASGEAVGAMLDHSSEKLFDLLADRQRKLREDFDALVGKEEARLTQMKVDGDRAFDTLDAEMRRLRDSAHRGNEHMAQSFGNWTDAMKLLTDTVRAGDQGMRKALEGK